MEQQVTIETKKCPQCQMDIAILAKICPHCRSKQKQPTSLLVKILLGVIVFAVFSSIISSSGSKSTSAPTSDTPATRVATPERISYEIVKRWTIPNGGEGKIVVISPDHLNEPDMVALGETLKTDTASDRNAFISVFDDKTAADLRDKVLADTATKAETDLYDKHFIGDYKKNGNTGFHEFSIFFDGVMGVDKKTIQY